MRIAINTRFGAYDYQEGYGRFIREISQGMAAANPDDNFFFYSDQPYTTALQQFSNVQSIIAGPPAKHPLLWKFWYDVRIPALLTKNQAAVFFSPDGICSLRTKVPQVLAIHDLAFLHYPQYLPSSQQWFLKQYTPAFIRKASRIITVSSFSRSDLLKKYPIIKDKVDVV
jgi:glycosyltransferase involved in cell wall biosynthesis